MAVTFIAPHNFAGTIGSTASDLFTPAAAGHQIILYLTDVSTTSGLIQATGSIDTPSVIPIGGSNNVADAFQTYALWGNLSASGSAQTWTHSQPNGDNTGIDWVLEFSGALSVKSTAFTTTTTAAAGTILGPTVNVPTGDMLVCFIVNLNGASGTPPTTSGAFASVYNSITTNGPYAGGYANGAGSNIQPSYTAPDNATYSLVSWVMSASAAGSSITPNSGSETIAGNAPGIVRGSVITPIVARRRELVVPERRLLVPNRRVFLPARHPLELRRCA